jgi:hypothetical protein
MVNCKMCTLYGLKHFVIKKALELIPRWQIEGLRFQILYNWCQCQEKHLDFYLGVDIGRALAM